MHSTNYRNTLITVATDCPVDVGTPPDRSGTVAAWQFALLSAAPYTMTSDQLLLAVATSRKGEIAAETFFAKPQACLRTSPLVKTYGFGLHHDDQGRVALVAKESPRYAELAADPAVTKRPGMRSSRG